MRGTYARAHLVCFNPHPLVQPGATRYNLPLLHGYRRRRQPTYSFEYTVLLPHAALRRVFRSGMLPRLGHHEVDQLRQPLEVPPLSLCNWLSALVAGNVHLHLHGSGLRTNLCRPHRPEQPEYPRVVWKHQGNKRGDTVPKCMV